MATHLLPILGWTTKPDSSGDVWFEPYSIKATNDVWDGLVCIFKDTSTRIGLQGRFTVPKNYVSSPEIEVYWTSTVTSGNVVWDFDYRAVAPGESLDQSGNQESLSVTDAAPASAHLRLDAGINLTAANLAVDDTVEFEIFRDGANGSDTMVGDAILIELVFEYSDV